MRNLRRAAPYEGTDDRMKGASSSSGETGRQRKTTLRTFRFPEELAHALDAEGQEQGMTVNALVSSILTKHVEWDAKAAKFGFIPAYKPVVTALLQASDEASMRCPFASRTQASAP